MSFWESTQTRWATTSDSLAFDERLGATTSLPNLISIGNQTNFSFTNATGSTLALTSLDCSLFSNGGKLTTDSNGVLVCANDSTGSGGGGGGTDVNWTYFNGSGISLSTTTNQVVIGASATSSTQKLQVSGGAYITGTVGIGTTTPSETLSVNGGALFAGVVRASRFVATSTTATSTFPNLSATNIAIGNDYISDITGAGLSIVNGALTVDATSGTFWATTSDTYAFNTLLAATTTLNNLTTLRGLTDIISTRATTTNATTTNLFATNASTTNLFVNGNASIGTSSQQASLTIERADGTNALYLSRAGSGFPSMAFNFSSAIPNIQTPAGALNIASAQTDATNKTLRLTFAHYNAITSGQVCALVALSDATASSLGVGGGSSGCNAPTNIVLYTGGTNTTLTGTAGFLMDNLQNIGIGVNVPTAKLHIMGRAGSTTDLFKVASSTSGEFFTIKATGNIGIGTTSPYAKLSVVGETVSEFFTATSTTATSTFPKLTSTFLNVGSDTVNDLTGAGIINVGGALTLDTSAAGLWATTSDTWNFGVRLSATTSLPNLSSLTGLATVGSTTGTTTFSGGAVFNGIVGVGSTTPNGKFVVTNIDSGPSFTVEDSAADLSPFIIDTTGNVGIGTTSTTNNKLIIQGRGISGGIAVQVTDNNGVPTFAVSDNGTIIFASTTSSQAIDPGVSANGTARTLRFRNNTTLANEGFQFWNGNTNTNLFMILQNGNVGVGTTSPVSKFAVSGDVWISGTATSSNFVATSTSATSTFPNLSLTNLAIGSDYVNDITGANLSVVNGALTVTLDGSFSTTSADYWESTKTRWATTSDSFAFDTRLAATTTLNNITTLGSLSLPLSQTTGTLPVSKGGTGQTSFGQGWLASDGTTITSSTSPTVAYLTSTSSATSTFAGGINLTGAGCFAINGGCIGGGSALSGAGAANKLAYWTGVGSLSYSSSLAWDNAVGEFTAPTLVATASSSILKLSDVTLLKVDTNLGNYFAGQGAGNATTSGQYNTATGLFSLSSLTSGTGNSGFGRGSLNAVTSGQNNVGIGYNAGLNIDSGDDNIAIGANALGNVAGADNNVGIGSGAGSTNVTGANNTFLGYGADVTTDGLTNATAIGYNATVGASDSIVLGSSGIKVGIGTSTPFTALSVNGRAAADYFTAVSLLSTSSLPRLDSSLINTEKLRISADMFASDNVIVIDGGDDYERAISFNESGYQDGYLSFDHNLGDFKLWNKEHGGTGGDIIFGLNNTEKFRMTFGGNFGIGTSSPYARLSVAGQTVTEYFTATSTTATSTFPKLTSTFLNVGSDTVNDLTGVGILNVGGALTVDSAGIVGTGTLGQVPYFASAGSALTATSSLYIASTSWIGMGTSVPQAGLHVVVQNKTGYRENFMKFGTTDAGNDAGYLTNGSLVNSNFLATLSGYTDSSATLGSVQLKGMTSAANDASDSASIGIIDLLSVIAADPIDPNNGNYSSVTNRKLLTIRGGTGTTGDLKFVISANGNVGIGTTTPYARLAVSGQTVSEYFTATSTTATSTLPLLSVSALSLNGQYVTSLWSTTTDSLAFDARLAASTSIPTLGSLTGLATIGSSTGTTTVASGAVFNRLVGIGTSTPTAPLEIAGGATGDRLRVISTNGAGNRTLDISRNLVTTGWSLQSTLTNSPTTAAGIFLNPNGGGVGIGTTTSTLPATLSVGGGAYIDGNAYVSGDITVGSRLTATTTKIQYISNPKITTLYTYGDSITQGALASSSSQYYPQILAKVLGYTLSNQGVNGSVLEEDGQIDAIYAQPVSTTTVATLLTGYNNHRYYGTGTTRLDTFKQALPAALAYLAIPDTNKVFASAFSTTGSWSATTTYATTTGRFTRTQGSTASTVLFGNTIYIAGTRGYTSDTGSVSVTVDGVYRGSYSCSGVASSFNDDRRYAPFMMRIGNLSNGQHSVTITSETSGYCEINWAAGNANNAVDGTPAVYVGGALRQTDTQYENNSPTGSIQSNRMYTEVIEGTAKLLAADGLNVVYVEAEKMFDPATMMSYDQVHPSALGHAAIADAFLDKMSGTSFGKDSGFSALFNGFLPKLTIGAGTTTTFTFDGETGRFGVGSSTPQYPLTVTGNAGITGQIFASTTASLSQPSFSFMGDTTTGLYRSATGTLSFVGQATEALTVSSSSVSIGTSTLWARLAVTNTGANPSFIVEDSASDSTPFIIDASGNVGIGTSTPSAQLEVTNGTATANRVRFITNSSSNRTLDFDRSLSATAWSIQSYITSSNGRADLNLNPLGGNIGIGTTTPYAKLSVNGDTVALTFTATSTTATSTLPLLSVSALSLNGQYVTSLWSTTTDSLAFDARLAASTSIPTLGSLTGLATVGSTTGTTTFSGGSVFNGIIGVGSTTPNGKFVITNIDSGPSFIVEDSAADLSPFIIDTTGRVGIGTTTTSVPKLAIQGNGVGTNANLQLYDSNGGATFGVLDNGIVAFASTSGTVNFIDPSISANGTARTMRFRNTTSSQPEGFQFWNGNTNTNLMMIQQSGNVGVGSTTPFGRFGIQGKAGSTTDLFVVASSSNANYMTIKSSGETGFGSSTPFGRFSINASSQSVGQPTFVVGSSTKTDFIIDQIGEVGVGTTSPWRTFSVSGTVAMNGLTTAAGTPSSICMNTATKEITVNAATSCVVSDRDQKQQIQDLTVSGLQAIRNIKPVTFAYNDYPGRSRIGFIAQDLQAVDNRLGDAFDKNGIARSIDIPAIMSITVKAVKELDTKVDIQASTTANQFLSLIGAKPTSADNFLINGDLTFKNNFTIKGDNTDYLYIKSNTGNTVLTFDKNGNIGVGTTTPAYKLQIAGDVAATAFVNVSTREAKKDITYLNDDAKFDALADLSKIKIAHYRYKTDSDADPLRLGLIAEEAPVSVLSASGKGVDLYKLTTFTLAAVQAQQKNIEAIDTRLTALEAKVASSTPVATEGLIASVISAIKDLTLNKLEIGTKEKPSGITLYDEETNEPYCLKMSGGKMKSTAGACGTVVEEVKPEPKPTTPDPVISTPAPTEAASSTATTTAPVTPEPKPAEPATSTPATNSGSNSSTSAPTPAPAETAPTPEPTPAPAPEAPKAEEPAPTPAPAPAPAPAETASTPSVDTAN